VPAQLLDRLSLLLDSLRGWTMPQRVGSIVFTTPITSQRLSPAYNPPESHLASPVSLEEPCRFDSSISLVACLLRLVSLFLPPWYPYFLLSHPVLCVAVEHFEAPWSHSVLPTLVFLTFPVLSNIMLR
jgi:hypothetical protein